MFSKTCLKFEDKINSSKNYNPSFLEGCSNFRKNAIVGQAKIKMHRKGCEFEDMQEALELGKMYKKR